MSIEGEAVDRIRKIFSNRNVATIQKLKKAAVMVLIKEDNGEKYIVFEVRSNKLKSQPGDICLPGGKVENNETPKEAAVRETMEELNLRDNDVEVIGEIDHFISPYGLIIYPFVGVLKGELGEPNKSEVDHLFKVPLSFFMKEEPLLYEMKIGPICKEGFPFHLINKGEDYNFRTGILEEYFYIYKDYVIWGFTAAVIKHFIDTIK